MKLQIKHINNKRAMALCPFHNDTNASLEVTLEGPHTGDYYCHGCNKSGQLTKTVLQQLLSRKPEAKHNKTTTPIDWKELTKKYADEYFWMKQKNLPFDVSYNTLILFDCGWDGASFTFPVCNSDEEIIGIQRRFPDGFKTMVEGSRLGLFIPELEFDPKETLFICEGVSDAATVVNMGFQAIGRFSCDTVEEDVQDWIDKTKFTPTNVYIISDMDEPGLKGADKLSVMLNLHFTHIIFPAYGKDIRDQYINWGHSATRDWLIGKIK
jgi:hypothetical protein